MPSLLQFIVELCPPSFGYSLVQGDRSSTAEVLACGGKKATRVDTDLFDLRDWFLASKILIPNDRGADLAPVEPA